MAYASETTRVVPLTLTGEQAKKMEEMMEVLKREQEKERQRAAEHAKKVAQELELAQAGWNRVGVPAPPVESTHRPGGADPFVVAVKNAEQSAPKIRVTKKHPVGEVQFTVPTLRIPYVELAQSRETLPDTELVRKYGPDLLEDLLYQIENWRTSHEIDPVSTKEQENIPDGPRPNSEHDQPCDCVSCYEDSL